MSLVRLVLLLLLAACTATPDAVDAGHQNVDGGTSTEDAGTATGDCPSSGAPFGTEWEDALGGVTVTRVDADACHRTWRLSSTAKRRDDFPPGPRTVFEKEGWPTLRTGHELFDALHALALEEVRENSVAALRDGAFMDGADVVCPPGGCFETGRLWHWVWTRDVAYAIDLGLAWLDPLRARNSLDFKVSERRGGGGLELVQDTGSGGSWPVSTDRVSWAVGAEAILLQLEGAERTAFRDRALEALTHTLERDRRTVFDPVDGLYGGETSFLDWREQTYPPWTADDVVHLAMSKALSTNVLHLRALELAAKLGKESGDSQKHERWTGWADELREAIRERFWLEEEGLFSSYTTTTLDPSPVRRFDLLGSALAVLSGVATEEQARTMLSRYPLHGTGAAVIWPQQQVTRIYHNRSQWPFVTAYWLRAAKQAGNDAVLDHLVRALVRGAAVNLSNMENLEAKTGAAFVDDGEYSGPVVNSHRQLWSVAGYVSMVHQTLFGLEPEDGGLRVRPRLTAALRETFFSARDELVLDDYPYRGRRLTVVLKVPAEVSGALGAGEVRLNGEPVEGDLLPVERLGETNRVEVTLVAATGSSEARVVTDDDWRDVFGPRTPAITSIGAVDGKVRLGLDRGGEQAEDVRFSIYRDGERVATDLPGSSVEWIDPSHDADGPRTPCYAVETTFVRSGNHSQHSPPVCWWGAGFERTQSIDASDFEATGGTPVTNHGRFHHEAWGDPGHTLVVRGVKPKQRGTHLFQVLYGNGAGPIETGVTCAVKWLTVEEEETGTVVAKGLLVMPHLGTWDRWADSNFVAAGLDSEKTYRVVISSDADAVNMSDFAHYERYTAGLGGQEGAFNRVNIAELKVLAR